MGIGDRDYMRDRAATGGPWWRRINISTALAIAAAAIAVISGVVWVARDVMPLFAHSAPAKGSLLVNINTATAEQLQTLPGIGPARARLIIDHRTYSSVDDLKRVNGIPDAVIEDLRPLLLVNGETQERAPR